MRIFNNNFFNKVICCVALFFLSNISFVFANSLSDSLSINGFYTVDATYTDNAINIVGAGGVRGYEKQSIGLKNSVIGGQISYQLTDGLSAYIQGSANYDDNGDPTAGVDWAYLSYDFGNDFVARVGRFQIPFLQGTELRKIGYSRLWARPLIPGTGASGFNEYKGLELFKKVTSGQNVWEFQAVVGKTKHGLTEVKNKNIKLAAIRYVHSDFWVRSSIMQADYSVFTPSGLEITNSGSVVMASIESEVTLDSWIAHLGLSRSDSDIMPDDNMHYVSLAYDFGSCKPFVLFSKSNQFSESFDSPKVNTPVDGAPFLPTIPPESPVIAPPPDGDTNTYSTAVGARWDVGERLGFKFQLEKFRIQDKARDIGNLTADGTAFSVVLDGVF